MNSVIAALCLFGLVPNFCQLSKQELWFHLAMITGCRVMSSHYSPSVPDAYSGGNILTAHTNEAAVLPCCDPNLQGLMGTLTHFLHC